MAISMDIETMRLRYRNKILIPYLKRKLSRSLKVRDFTIISNNCWAGTVYETYDLPKQSPTVGMFIMPDDYLQFAGNLDKYLAEPLEFIAPEESKWISELGEMDTWGKYLIGRIGDVELHMLHYHDLSDARRKWERRIRRVNRDRLIFKFNDQNGATDDHLRRFDALDLKNKLVFTVRDVPDLKSGVRVRAPRSHRFVRASYEPLRGSFPFNVADFINSCFRPVG